MFEVSSQLVVQYFFAVIGLGLVISIATVVKRGRAAGSIRDLDEQDWSVAFAWVLFAPPFAAFTVLYGYGVQYLEWRLGWAFALGFNFQIIAVCFALGWWTRRREQRIIAAQPRDMEKAEV